MKEPNKVNDFTANEKKGIKETCYICGEKKLLKNCVVDDKFKREN